MNGRGPPDPRAQAITFHAIGTVACVVALMVAIYASLAPSFDHKTCDPGQTPHDVRFGIAGIGVALAIVPAVVALLARRLGHAPWPWAALAALAVLGTARAVLTTNHDGQFCF